VTVEVRLDPLVEEDFEKAEAKKVQHCFQRHQVIEHRFAQEKHQKEENKDCTSSLAVVAVGAVVAETTAGPLAGLVVTPLATVGPSVRQFRVNLAVLIAIAVAAAAADIVAAAVAVAVMEIEAAAVGEAEILPDSVVALGVVAALGVNDVNAEVAAVAAVEASSVVLGAVAVVGVSVVAAEAAIVAATVVVAVEDETGVPDLEKGELNRLKKKMRAGCYLAVVSHPLNHPAVSQALELLARVSSSSWEPSAL